MLIALGMTSTLYNSMRWTWPPWYIIESCSVTEDWYCLPKRDRTVYKSIATQSWSYSLEGILVCYGITLWQSISSNPSNRTPMIRVHYHDPSALMYPSAWSMWTVGGGALWWWAGAECMRVHLDHGIARSYSLHLVPCKMHPVPGCTMLAIYV